MRGATHSYLGMQITLQHHRVLIDMPHLVKATLVEFHQKMKLTMIKLRSMPDSKRYFVVNNESPLLNDLQKKIFHTVTAKLLYLAKRAHPEILTVTSFLCTRVKAPTEEDVQKLMHTLCYL